jgi:hypothetical protein
MKTRLGFKLILTLNALNITYGDTLFKTCLGVSIGWRIGNLKTGLFFYLFWMPF